MRSRPELRRRLESLATDADLVEFCLVYCPEVQRQFTDGMIRKQKLNLLLESFIGREDELWALLDKAVEDLQTPRPPSVRVPSTKHIRDPRPANQVLPNQAITILHVSDMQFGRNHRFGQLSPASPDEKFDTLLQRLVDDLVDLERSYRLKPDLIALTGDLAEWGMKAEFDQVLAFADGIARHLKLERDRVLVIPGNHDVNRKLCSAYFDEQEGTEQQPVPPYWRKWKPYLDFFDGLYKEVQRYRFTELEPYTLFEVPNLKVVVAGLNSTMRESHRAEDHYGWLGEGQLRAFRDKLAGFRARGWLRVGLVHHNVLRRATDDDENLRDADALKEILADSLNLLLHGHTHLSADETLGALAVLSTGSASVKKEQRPEEVPSQYQLLRVHRSGVSIFARQYDVRRKRWIGDTRVSRDGNAWRYERKVDFQDVDATFGAGNGGNSEKEEDEGIEILSRSGRDDRQRGWPRPGNGLLGRVIEDCAIRSENNGRRMISVRVENVGQWGEHAQIIDPDRGRYVLGVVDGELDAGKLDVFIRDVHEPFRSRSGLPGAISDLVIAAAGTIPAELHLHAQSRGVTVQRLTDYQQILDVAGHRAALLDRLDKDPVYPHDRYLEQRLAAWNPAFPQQHKSIEAAADWIVDRLREPDGTFLLVLGQAGAGKTFLLHEVARRLVERQQVVTPLLIDLRNLERAHTVAELAALYFAQHDLSLPLRAFNRDLREGRIALLFDGFDELALRVKSSAIPEHFQRILQSASERARIVVSSRTEHFLSKGQVQHLMTPAPADLTSLGVQLIGISRRQIVAVQPFRRDDVEHYLKKTLGEAAGARRFELLGEVHDLVGLAANPRMLAFLVEIPEEKLQQAAQLKDAITSADLYRIVVEESWLTGEVARLNQPGAAQGLTLAGLRDAATHLALHLWRSTAKEVAAADLPGHVSPLLQKLCESDLDHAVTTLRTRTLLSRNDAGQVGFIHQTVAEYLVACALAEEIQTTGTATQLAAGRVNDFIVDVLRQRLGAEVLAAWAERALAGGSALTLAENARDVLKRLGRETRRRADLRGQDLRGQDLGGQELRGALLDEANLTGVRLVGRDLSHASLRKAQLAHADLSGSILTHADLSGADLAFARLHRATIAHLKLDGASLVGASFLGARGAAELDYDLDQAVTLTRGCTPSTWPPMFDCRAVTYSPDGRLIACGDADGKVCVFEVISGRLLRVLKGHSGHVLSVAFSPDGRTLASGANDSTVCLWQAADGKPLRVLKGHSGSVLSVAFSPDGRTVASGADDSTVCLWQAADGKQLRVLKGHSGRVLSVAFSPDGNILASGAGDSTVCLWQAADGKQLRVFKGHSGRVLSVAFSPDGRIVASGADDTTVCLWQAADGKQLRVLKGHSGRVWSVAFSPDGRTLASGANDTTVCLWQAADGKQLRLLQGHSGSVWSVAFSPDGRTLASGANDSTVCLWQAADGKQLRVLKGHSSSVWSVAFSPDGKTLASGADDTTVCLWQAADGKQLRMLKGHSGNVWSVAFSPDGRTLASGADDSTVCLWRAADGKQLRVLKGHSGRVLSVAFSPDGKTLASGANDSTVCLWQAADGKQLRVFKGHSGSVLSVAFSPDGRTLASGADDSTVCLWQAADGKQLRVLKGHSSSVLSVAFSPDGRTLASGANDSDVCLWQAADGKQLRLLQGHSGNVLSVAFSPDGRTVASGAHDSTVCLWQAADGKQLRVLKGHSSSVWSVAFSPDGRTLASGAHDNTMRLWELETGKCVAVFFSGPQGSVVYRPDGRYKLSGDIGGLFFHTIGLHRYEVGELDEFVPGGLRIPENELLLAGR